MKYHDIWLTSDTHFFHKNVIQYCNRPYSSVEEMNEALISNWNSVVKDGDTIYHLGDVIFAGAKKASSILSRLNGNKILIQGNHDYQFKLPKWQALGFSQAFTSLSLFCAFHNQQVGLVHNPGGPQALGMQEEWILNGHVHEKWTQRQKNINVGVDVWEFKPVHLDQIMELINAGPRDF